MARREDSILTRVRECIVNNKLIDNNDIIVLGLSGGPDSVFLLYALEELKGIFKSKYNISYDMIICHVNHMIRKEAKKDEKLAREYAKKYKLKFYSLEIDVHKIAKEKKMSEEECGRDIRYEFFAKILKENKANKIAVAHNANDNAETVLHNIMRGTGLNGLIGIKIKNGKIIRPILNIEKKEIIKYLDEKGVKYNIDRTNLETVYTRNKIRNDLIKKIEKEYNPNVVYTINRMAYSLSNDLEYISSVAVKEYSQRLIKKNKDIINLDIKGFNNEEEAIKSRIVILAIKDLLGDIKGIEETHIRDICKLMNNHITGKKFIIDKKVEIIIEKNKVAKFCKK